MTDLETDDPLVSVIITTYNRPDLLVEALESVQAQTYENVEIVVVDDHSDTPAEEVVDDTSDVRIIRHEENRGANAARNTGIRESNGDLIAFLDDDDRWLPSKLRQQVPLFEDESVGLVYTGARSVDDDDETIAVFRPKLEGDVTTDMFAGGYIGSFSKVVVRRSTIEEAGTLDERFPSWQDRDWYLRLSEVCEFDYVSDVLVVHRSPEVQISSDYESKRDVTYPLFVSKHRPLAASYGSYHERRFMASITHTLGASALHTGHYREGAKYLARSLRYFPASPRTVLYLMLALGGSRTFRGAQQLKHGVVNKLVNGRS